MRRRTTALVAAAVALAGLVLGLGVAAVDGGWEPAAQADDACAATPPLIAVDQPGPMLDGGGQVVVIRPDGTTAPATPDDWVATQPDIGPDQQRLVVVRADGDYESAGPEATHLVAIGLDGAEPRPLTEGDAYDSAPRWSPDGGSVAFLRQPAGGWPTLQVVGADGGEPRPVVAAPDGVELAAPEWSPDGARIAYLRRPLGADGMPAGSTLWTVAADGTGPTEIGPVADDAVSVDWHPDGGRLLVSSLAGVDGEVSIVEAASGEATVVARGATGARWSRGGSHIVHHTQIGTIRTDAWRLVERPVENTGLGDPRELGVETPFLYPYFGLSVAACGP